MKMIVAVARAGGPNSSDWNNWACMRTPTHPRVPHSLRPVSLAHQGGPHGRSGGGALALLLAGEALPRGLAGDLQRGTDPRPGHPALAQDRDQLLKARL